MKHFRTSAWVAGAAIAATALLSAPAIAAMMAPLSSSDPAASAASSAPAVAMMKTPEGMNIGEMLLKQTAWHSGPATIIVRLANNDRISTMGARPALINVTLR